LLTQELCLADQRPVFNNQFERDVLLTYLAAGGVFLSLQRNYRTFLLFIYGTSVYIAWTFGVSLGSLFVKHSELVAAAASRPAQESEGLSSNLWLQTLSAYASGGGRMGAFGFPPRFQR
jgi:hypothetical protein